MRRQTVCDDPSRAEVSKRSGSVRVVLDEYDAAAAEGKRLVQRERQRRLWTRIHDERVAELRHLSATTMAGLPLNAAFGLWWAGPVATLVIAVFLVRETREAWECEDEER